MLTFRILIRQGKVV